MNILNKNYSNEVIKEYIKEMNSYQYINDKDLITHYDILNKMLKSLRNRITTNNMNLLMAEVCDVSDKIYFKIKNDKKTVKNVENFCKYYLPTIFKIIIRYDEIENLGLSTSRCKEFMKLIENSMEIINSAFNKQLEFLYNQTFFEVEVELKVLESVLKSDGFLDELDFQIKK